MLKVDDCCRFLRNGKYGLKNKHSGRIIVGAVYDDIRRIKGSVKYIKVRKDDLWGVINCCGDEILKPVYRDILFYDGIKFIAFREDTRVYIEYPREYTRPVGAESEINSPYSVTNRVTPENLPYQTTISTRLGGKHRR